MTHLKEAVGNKPLINDVKPDKQINIRIENIIRTLYYIFLIQLILNLAFIILTEYGIEDFYGFGKFYFDLEESVPTYFSSFILLFAAILLALIAAIKTSEKGQFSTHWTILSLLFTVLSVDEIAGFHEIIIDPINLLIHATGYIKFSWVIPAFIFMIFFSLSYVKFINSLPGKYKKGFILSCFIYLTGTIGFEMISAKLFINDAASAKDLLYNLVITIEESCEMTGIILFISVLLSYIKSSRLAAVLIFK